jgi:hypothetical protein
LQAGYLSNQESYGQPIGVKGTNAYGTALTKYVRIEEASVLFDEVEEDARKQNNKRKQGVPQVNNKSSSATE